MKLPCKWVDVKKSNIGEARYPAYAQLKLDGELIAWDGYERKLYNSYGREKSWVKTDHLPSECMLFGELYYKDGRDFYTYLRNQFNRELKLSFFDVISVDGQVVYGVEPYEARWKILWSLGVDFPDTHEVYSSEEADDIYKEVVADGYEGVVIKPFDSLTCDSWVKHKRVYYDTLSIVGKKKGKEALLVGTPDHIYGAVSTIGWNAPLNKALTSHRIMYVREDKEAVYFTTEVKVEVEHNGYIQERESDVCVSLRNPRLHRICSLDEKLTMANLDK